MLLLLDSGHSRLAWGLADEHGWVAQGAVRNQDIGTLALREWLPILDAGLAALTVGVIPPALDQVLIGAIDRSRNPELQIAFILGVNEGVFPAPPADPVLLTESERAQLEGSLKLGTTLRQQLAHERFYGYIACTRARQKLFVTFSDADRRGNKLNPSAFISHLQRLKLETH